VSTSVAKLYRDIEPGHVDESDWLALDEAAMIAFAREWDPMPFHVDPDAAADTLFGAVTASSVYSWALKQKLVKQLIDPRGVVGMLGFDEGRLAQPLYANRRVKLVIDWLEKRASRSQPDRGVVRFRVRLVTDRDETALDYIEALLMWVEVA
jgi:acyl dehydratase